jgi:uncharacterized protein (TIGR00251 family)
MAAGRRQSQRSGGDGGEPSEGRDRVRVKVVPNARVEGIVGFEAGQLRVRVRAPAVDGKANEALVALLAKAGGCGRGDIQIVAGTTSRSKVLSLPAGAFERLKP